MESSKRPSSSSSSPDSTLEDPFKGDAKEHKRSASTTSLPKVDQDPSQSTELSSDKLSTKESPPTCVMDQSGESSYRIPSSVFTRTQSLAPAEWSVTSNDGPPTDLAKSGELAVETMKEVLIENVQQQGNGNNQRDDRITRQESCHGSTKSFAFPILAGDVEKVHSVTTNSSVKAAALAPAQAPEKAQAKAEVPAKAEPDTKKPKSTWTKWFPCFTRCRFCS
ncbi:hypothetical protein LguiA_028312 [Lonicera macranthoides]